MSCTSRSARGTGAAWRDSVTFGREPSSWSLHVWQLSLRLLASSFFLRVPRTPRYVSSFFLGVQGYLLRLPERPRPSALVPAVVAACQLGAWWSVGTLDSVSRTLLDWSAWLVEPFAVRACACPAAGTLAPRLRAPLTTLCREALWKVLLCVRPSRRGWLSVPDQIFS